MFSDGSADYEHYNDQTTNNKRQGKLVKIDTHTPLKLSSVSVLLAEEAARLGETGLTG